MGLKSTENANSTIGIIQVFMYLLSSHWISVLTLFTVVYMGSLIPEQFLQ